MEFDQETLNGITSMVWSSTLGLEPVPAEKAVVDPNEERVTGCVQISGSWDGAILLEFPGNMARRLTAIMFGSDPETTNVEEVHDAIGELTNMVGGNVKSILASPSQLSLPVITAGQKFDLRIRGSKAIAAFGYHCEGGTFVLRILQKEETK